MVKDFISTRNLLTELICLDEKVRFCVGIVNRLFLELPDQKNMDNYSFIILLDLVDSVFCKRIDEGQDHRVVYGHVCRLTVPYDSRYRYDV